MKFKITCDLASEIRSYSVVGAGGFQSLINDIKSRVIYDDVCYIDIDDALWDRINRYVNEYGDGGFQRLLDRLLSECKK